MRIHKNITYVVISLNAYAVVIILTSRCRFIIILRGFIIYIFIVYDNVSIELHIMILSLHYYDTRYNSYIFFIFLHDLLRATPRSEPLVVKESCGSETSRGRRLPAGADHRLLFNTSNPTECVKVILSQSDGRDPGWQVSFTLYAEVYTQVKTVSSRYNPFCRTPERFTKSRLDSSFRQLSIITVIECYMNDTNGREPSTRTVAICANRTGKYAPKDSSLTSCVVRNYYQIVYSFLLNRDRPVRAPNKRNLSNSNFKRLVFPKGNHNCSVYDIKH